MGTLDLPMAFAVPLFAEQRGEWCRSRSTLRAGDDKGGDYTGWGRLCKGGKDLKDTKDLKDKGRPWCPWCP